MDLSPSAVRRKTFEMVRRGYDPQEVGSYLEALAERVAEQQRELDQVKSSLSGMEGELSDAKAAEEALQMTMIAATQAKDEMLANARTEADRLLSAAQAEAKESVESARRQSLELLETSRREAEEMAGAAKAENEAMSAQVDVLRDVVARSRTMLASATEEAQAAEALIEQAAVKGQQADTTARRAEDPAPVEVEQEESPVAPEPVATSDEPVVEEPVVEEPVVEAEDAPEEPITEAVADEPSVEVAADEPPSLEVVNGEVSGESTPSLSNEDLPDEVDRLLQQLRSNR